jgi:hypothetical protein
VRGVVVGVGLLVAERGGGDVDGQVGGHPDGRDVARRVERGADAKQLGDLSCEYSEVAQGQDDTISAVTIPSKR